MNEIIQIIKERRNTKNFVDKDVAKIDIETLLDTKLVHETAQKIASLLKINCNSRTNI